MMKPANQLLSFCTTCMNREEFLKQTLPPNLAVLAQFPTVNLVLVNYNSSGDLSEWIKPYLENSQLHYYEERTREHFHMSHAKNMSHRLSTADYVINLDGDNFLTYDYVKNALNSIHNGAEYIHYISTVHDGGLCGRIGASAKLFAEMRGYDEAFVGWGGDDLDFSDRCLATKYKRAYPLITESKIIHQNFAVKGANYPEGMQDIGKTYKQNQVLMADLTRIVNASGFGQGIVFDKNNNKIILN